MRGLAESLRSWHPEAAKRLHTVVSLVELGRTEEALDFVTEEREVAQLLTDRVVGSVSDPVVSALLLGKPAQAAEQTADGPVCRGLGLALVVQAVRKFDGRIEVGTSALGGAEFEVAIGSARARRWCRRERVPGVGVSVPLVPA